jgi:hypothetical protein
MPYYNYVLGLVNTSVRLIGGFVSAYFQYLNDISLHKLTHVIGEVE